MKKSLYIAWNDTKNRKWTPVGQLSYEKDVFTFCYTQGAKQNENFRPFGAMKDLDKKYEAPSLFPIFENRLLGKNRPEYNKLMEWLNLTGTTPNQLDVLALTEGKRETDSLELFPCPVMENNQYTITFFLHGLNYIAKDTSERLEKLEAEEQLYLCLDCQNEHDENAIILRTKDPISYVGYAPRYLTTDFKMLLTKNPKMTVKVKQVNIYAPMRYKIMCTVTTPWPQDFRPCSDEAFVTLV